MIFELKNKVSKANLNANKRILKSQPFLHRAYCTKNVSMSIMVLPMYIFTFILHVLPSGLWDLVRLHFNFQEIKPPLNGTYLISTINSKIMLWCSGNPKVKSGQAVIIKTTVDMYPDESDTEKNFQSCHVIIVV